MTRSVVVPGWATAWLSPGRLAPYVQAVGAGGALELYHWNCEVSAALFELVGWFEVAWRNMVDAAITTRHPDRPHWLFDPTFPLGDATRGKVRRVVGGFGSAESTARPTPDQVIAELSLGFWRFTTKGYQNTIWAPYLSSAFPFAPTRPGREVIDQKFLAIIRLRNRIAHHEPIFNGNQDSRILGRVNDMLLLGEWINPEAAAWWRRRVRVGEVMARCPRFADPPPDRRVDGDTSSER